MSRRVNREGLTQRTVLLLQWGMERARCPVEQHLLRQEQQGWGPEWAYNCNTTLAPQQLSRCFRVGLKQCRKSNDNYLFVSQVGFLPHAWESAARQRLTCGSYQSAFTTGEETRAHSSSEATWAFVTGMEQPLAESLTREGKRTAGSCPCGTPQVDLRHMLEGDVPQDQMTVFIFRGGIRKLSYLNMVIGNNTNVYLIRCHLEARTSSIEQRTCATKR